MEISSNEEMMEMAIVEQLPPSSHHLNGGSVEVDMEEDHVWPTKDGPLPIFLKVCISISSSIFRYARKQIKFILVDVQESVLIPRLWL